ncbi:ParB N-terminal domain-containing protein [Actinomadura alba]|uniref:ParB N-terminal domain-containing protein n=1 Tax=Actinomadura alba TaxID=406431 RepID=A0ABR7LQS1_9ACTN|nr:ParB N-terminal domain-containing protein [Actinomadura alba]MBC6467191.1 ParB N-terminal domain-containing protein [Actinomadura alba]
MSTVRNQVRRKSRTALRKAGLVPSGPVYGRIADKGRALPVPPKARILLSTAILRRPWRISVPLDRLLLGAQGGWTARGFAERTGDLLWPSTPLLDGPHIALLRRASDGEPTDEELLDSPYGRLAQRCIDAGGDYFGATDDAGVVASARAFISRSRGHDVPGDRRPQQSTSLDPVLVAPVRNSSYYQVLDGHHRLALAAHRGETTARVVAKWAPVTTPLQDLLLKMSWLDGTKELYQPIDAPELRDSWTTVRRCTDRRDKMLAFLRERGIGAPATYLDVASCYGWFVDQLRHAGFTAGGIERDPLAVPLGRAVYGLPEGVIGTGDCVELLGTSDRRWDVVSCFSLLHHFVLGRGSVGHEELIRLLDGVTGQVLFFDTGQENETWFKSSLRGWNPESIAGFLRANTSFDEIVDLGPDDDARPPYADNYGRHLFACVRSRP